VRSGGAPRPVGLADPVCHGASRVEEADLRVSLTFLPAFLDCRPALRPAHHDRLLRSLRLAVLGLMP
jgi:hypothetical protein